MKDAKGHGSEAHGDGTGNRPWEQAYRKWRGAAAKGYGDKTHYLALAKVDDRIRRLKADYKNKLVAEKAAAAHQSGVEAARL